MALQRFVYGHDPSITGVPTIAAWVFGRILKGRAKSQGYGLHSKEEGRFVQDK